MVDSAGVLVEYRSGQPFGAEVQLHAAQDCTIGSASRRGCHTARTSETRGGSMVAESRDGGAVLGGLVHRDEELGSRVRQGKSPSRL